MKILLIGNIGSGKTTLGKKIQEITGYKFVQIDEIREKYLEKKVSKEYYCIYEFLKAIENNDNIILEFTGAGCHKFAIKRALELTKDKLMLIQCKNRNFSIILERLIHKKLSEKFPFNTDIETHVNYIKKELDNESLEGFWKFKKSIFINIFMDNFHDLTENVRIIANKLNQLENDT